VKRYQHVAGDRDAADRRRAVEAGGRVTTNEPDPAEWDDIPDDAVVVACDGPRTSRGWREGPAPSHKPHVIRLIYTGHPLGPGTELIHRLNDEPVVTGTASVIKMAMGAVDDPSLRGRWPLECSICGDRVEVRGERLGPIIDALARHGQTRITLSGLRYMLRP